VSVYGLSEDELDLLADFTAGVLTDDEHERIARLVGTDGRWASAHADLLHASQAVSADLRSVAGPLPMPPHVASRIDAAIASAGAPSGRRVVPLRASGHVHTSGHAGQRSRWRRAGLAVVGVAAAAVVLACGIGLASQYGRHVNSTSATGAGAGQPQLAAPAAPSPPGGPSVVSSGRNYQPATLGQVAGLAYRAAPPAPAGAPEAVSPAPSGFGGAASGKTSNDLAQTQGPLARLTSPDALHSCLAAVQASHPGTPVLVDFAAFQGSPAVVVVVQQQGGAPVAVVVGPTCGLGGSDERYAAPIG
jgi:hypothetical protein